MDSKNRYVFDEVGKLIGGKIIIFKSFLYRVKYSNLIR